LDIGSVLVSYTDGVKIPLYSLHKNIDVLSKPVMEEERK